MKDSPKKLFRIGFVISLELLLMGHQANAEVNQANLDLSFLDDINQGIGKALDNLFNSNPLDKLQNTKCQTSYITGEISGVKKKGSLVLGTNCDDKINGNESNEIIYARAGIDDVYAGAGNDIIYGGKDDNRLFGQQGDDIIISEADVNLIDGGPGNDALFGGSGNDLLIGGDGNDQLIAGIGITTMIGGNGSNEFYCGSNAVVLDYNPANGDLLGGQCNIINNVGFDLSGDINIP
ncbi:MAG TPA: calcium-binding protein [Nitrososphaeraceae archaeon]|nr:calcium-binding protein [Nitrososphaeraceae archaeon]